MNVGELLKVINKGLDNNYITTDSEIIMVGQYGYGDNLNHAGYSMPDEFVYLEGETLVKSGKPQLVFRVDNYLYETEDVGYSDMWIPKEEFEEFNGG